MNARRPWLAGMIAILATIMISFWGCATKPEVAKDEAKLGGRQPTDFPEVGIDFFADMDGGIELTEDEVKGRNTWLLWTAGNQAFWDYLANHSIGTVDLLKILDTRKRDTRFSYYGMMNEPGFKKASRTDEFGLWLDEPVGTPMPGLDTDVYGRSSGVIGLRLYPNPAFDETAKQQWDPVRYYEDRSYYYDPNLVRPYRVGMTCGFCHVGPDPTNPPADPENPQWENLSSYVGAQYFWVGRIFTHDLGRDNFAWQLFNSSPPGTLDTSFIATDNINNPRTMNAIYEVGARLQLAEVEDLAGGNLDISGAKPRMPVPHILKDGADSVGILGALARVYINIGAYHEEWVQHFRPLVGGKPQTPIRVADAQANSVYWQATEGRVTNLAKFFLRAARPHRLEDAPGGSGYLSGEEAMLTRGKVVFADHCADCHSSKQPPFQAGPESAEFRDWMRREALTPDFRDSNYFSTDRRYSVAEIQTNACSTLATNGIRGHVWDNFTSETYKSLPAVGSIRVQHPLDDTTSSHAMPGGGRGYHRAPSLVSMWSTAPYFHNNSLGNFTNDPSVAGRMQAFDDAVEKLLWPERRADNYCQQRWGEPFCPPVYRTTETSYLVINRVFLPERIRDRVLDEGETELRIGPIPQGTPIGLLSNIDNEIEFGDGEVDLELAVLLVRLKKALKRIKEEDLNEAQSREVLKSLVPDLLEVSKCADFVVDRGHYYGADLSDADKGALIEFLKTI